ncbi:S8 family serine peptidase [Deminuibacter soli]|uniref:Peptidase S8 and S53 subtilisin kexin sedolisin n=1 Tax=Deminuibacter soli TaxID=2291815 RepID=A0A3E1NKV7_9BACT|nr:S8 family serine peptidase [Deminuibacter soli]RFM28570.1 peptidase S8 and S53 subtilisin kexin sedolisin [Deminuibacter soli]
MRKSTIWSLLMCCAIVYSCRKEEVNNVQRQTPLSYNNRHEDRGFIILAKEGSNLESIATRLTSLGCKKFVLKESIPEIGLIHVQTPDPSFAAKARGINGVESVVVDIVSHWLPKIQTRSSRIAQPLNAGAQPEAKTAKSVGDSYSFLQWGLKSVNAFGAWDQGYKGAHATVAVLDGGFLTHNPELVANIVGSKSFIDGEEVEYHGEEGFSHGSHVAGTIAAISDGLGVAGVAPKAKLLLVKVLADNGSGPWSSLINGLMYASKKNVDVVNMSLGALLPLRTYTDDNGTPDDPSDDFVVQYDRDVKQLVTALNRATLYATLHGATLIAASGNDGVNVDAERNYTAYPAACAGVLAIAANGPHGWGHNQDTSLYLPAPFSNIGKSLISYGAPGGNDSDPEDFSEVNVGGVVAPALVFDWVFNIGFVDETTSPASYFYGWAAGTSMAAPHASAVAALIYDKYRGLASPLLVDIILRGTAVDYGPRGKDAFFGYGQVNAARAVR